MILGAIPVMVNPRLTEDVELSGFGRYTRYMPYCDEGQKLLLYRQKNNRVQEAGTRIE